MRPILMFFGCGWGDLTAFARLESGCTIYLGGKSVFWSLVVWGIDSQNRIYTKLMVFMPFGHLFGGINGGSN